METVKSSTMFTAHGTPHQQEWSACLQMLSNVARLKLHVGSSASIQSSCLTVFKDRTETISVVRMTACPNFSEALCGLYKVSKVN